MSGHVLPTKRKKIIARELKIDEDEVKRRGPGSSILPKRASRSDIMNLKK